MSVKNNPFKKDSLIHKAWDNISSIQGHFTTITLHKALKGRDLHYILYYIWKFKKRGLLQSVGKIEDPRVKGKKLIVYEVVRK